jgi:hypothetical protein
MDGEWHSVLPDGRDVEVRRRGEYWIVSCGHSQARSDNLDVALAQAIRAEFDVDGHVHEVHYPTWIRQVADQIAPPE